VTRARSAFFHGEKTYLLMTERFQFFRRVVVRGIRHVVFYGLPQTKQL
jgi:U3 small nucleolar RNA-associated protein 25